MHRQVQLFQRAQQGFQAVRQGNGGCGVGEKERAHNQHKNPAHHKNRLHQTLGGDFQSPERHQDIFTGSHKQVQNAGKNQNENQRLQAFDNGFQGDGGHVNHCAEKYQHNAVGDPAVGCKQGDEIDNEKQQLGSGIQEVNGRFSREILAQGNVLKHG